MVGVPSNAISSGQGNTATVTSAILVQARGDRKRLTIINGAAVVVAVGGPGVTVLNGALIPATIGAQLVLETTAAVYAIAASGTPVSWIEEYA
jgi:hypothetical protein